MGSTYLVTDLPGQAFATRVCLQRKPNRFQAQARSQGTSQGRGANQRQTNIILCPGPCLGPARLMTKLTPMSHIKPGVGAGLLRLGCRRAKVVDNQQSTGPASRSPEFQPQHGTH